MESAFAREWRRTFAPSSATLVSVAGNAALVLVAWFVLPSSLHRELSGLEGVHALGLTLCSWMVAGTPATNVYGLDPAGATRALVDAPSLRRFLLAKGVVLWLLCVPACAAVDLATAPRHATVASTVAALMVLAAVPPSTLGFAGCFSALLPYRPRALASRRHHVLRAPLVTARWVFATSTPYVVFPAMALACLAPLHHLGLPGDPHRRLSESSIGAIGIAALAVAVAAAMLAAGYTIAVRLGLRRRADVLAIVDGRRAS